MKLTARWFLATVVLWAGYPGRAAEITLVADRDNSIFSESDNSAGAASTVFSGRNNQGNPRRALFRFDVAGSIPAGSTIDGVSLTLHMNGAAQVETQARDFVLHRVTADWGEGSSGIGGPGGGMGAAPAAGDATWNYRFYDTEEWTTGGGDFTATPSAATSVGTSVDYYTWTSTSLLVDDVQAWLDSPTANFGWILIGPEDVNASARRFESREAAVELRPSLYVEFTPVPEPGTIVLLATAGILLLWRNRRI